MHAKIFLSPGERDIQIVPHPGKLSVIYLGPARQVALNTSETENEESKAYEALLLTSLIAPAEVEAQKAATLSM